MIDPQVAFDKLIQFESADDIAAYLQSCRIKAFPGRIDRCALAAWFQETTEQSHIVVTGEEIRIEDINHRTQRFGLTHVLKDFIDMFDHEFYPELICREAEHFKFGPIDNIKEFVESVVEDECV